MTPPSQNKHPLLHSAGMSQRKRTTNFVDVQAEKGLIDGRPLEDILDYIHQYARQVVFYDFKSEAESEAYVELSNWLVFFEKSLPFQLVRFHKIDFGLLERDIENILLRIEQDPNFESLTLLLDFIYFELLIPLQQLYQQVHAFEFGFVAQLENIIRARVVAVLMRFIEWNQASCQCFGTNQRDFSAFVQAPWSITDAARYPVGDANAGLAPKNNAEFELPATWKEELNQIALQLLSSMRQAAQQIPPYLQASIDALRGRHEPHLGLLFAFIRLFRHFQGDLNQLTQAHLRFFYEEVLKIKPKEMVPDQVHLVFEKVKTPSNPTYLIKKDTVFKDGKDAQNTDVLFKLDDEIVIDEAQIKALSTLYLHQPKWGSPPPNRYIEGLYIAPVANSRDGKGLAFQEEPKNWYTLGSKPSKLPKPINDSVDKNSRDEDPFENHALGRIGFVLASSVLWLNEGKRSIVITLSCTHKGKDFSLNECIKDFASFFSLQFSGEEGWFTPGKFTVEFSLKPSYWSENTQFNLIFKATLDAGEPKITFYDAAAGKEKFSLQPTLPMVKIELKQDQSVACESPEENPVCNLAKAVPAKNHNIAPYHFLRDLYLDSATIEVEVCGVKNLLVQNEESLQDVNNPILPFGTRPKVGAEFYIGSKEVFGKNWTQAWLNVVWKAKPDKLQDHYREYQLEGEVFEDGKPLIQDESFRLDCEILKAGKWENRWKGRELFKVLEPAPFCTEEKSDYDNSYNIPPLKPSKNEIWDNFPLEPLNVNSREDFLKLILQGVSFQHERYPRVLATKLVNLAGLSDSIKFNTMYGGFKKINTLISKNQLDDDIKPPNMTNPSGMEFLLTQLEKKINQLDKEGDPILGIPEMVELNTTLATDLTKLLKIVTLPEGARSIDAKKMSSFSEGFKATFAKYSSDLDKIINSIKEIPDGVKKPIEEIKALLDDALKVRDAIQEQVDAILVKEEIQPLTLPKEPYTPTIKSISIDYQAVAEHEDIHLIHLYPFDDTHETIKNSAGSTLFPHFADEGSLFIGIHKLRPGSTVQFLFQFAEATADSELSRKDIQWHYLERNNTWGELRQGFEILRDDTQRLTRSGLVKIALPMAISNQENTIMPPTETGEHLYWLKVSVAESVGAVAESLGVHLQSALATYHPLPTSDKNRSGKPLAPEMINKLLQPDFNIKKINQPYASFAGQSPEQSKQFYIRVSEHLRHKGRSINTFDIEHLVLEAFPTVFKCKCITHTYGLSAHEFQYDFEAAPGYVTIAVIPDLTKIIAGNNLEPKLPVSILTDIKTFVAQRMSPFARIRVMNPRYEPVDVEVQARFKTGRDKKYHEEVLKNDIAHFLAPWYLGDSDKLSFGQPLVYSDLVGFIENLEYIDQIVNLKLNGTNAQVIEPRTARSILSGGSINIESDKYGCEEKSSNPSEPAAQSNPPELSQATPSAPKKRPFLRGFGQRNKPLD